MNSQRYIGLDVHQATIVVRRDGEVKLRTLKTILLAPLVVFSPSFIIGCLAGHSIWNRMWWRTVTLTMLALIFCGCAHAEACTLQTYASSWMQSGTPFSVQCPSGKYDGVLITNPARRFFRRGSLVLKFNQPMAAVASKNGEGVFQPGRGKQISSMLLSGGAGIGTKDLTDGLSGAVFKSYYMIPVTFGALAILEKGGDVLLKPGFKLNVETTR